jgi:hypothetical protein
MSVARSIRDEASDVGEERDPDELALRMCEAVRPLERLEREPHREERERGSPDEEHREEHADHPREREEHEVRAQDAGDRPARPDARDVRVLLRHPRELDAALERRRRVARRRRGGSAKGRDGRPRAEGNQETMFPTRCAHPPWAVSGRRC